MSRVAHVWNATSEDIWLTALNNYWSHIETRRPKNLTLEKELDSLDPMTVKSMSPADWYEFLESKYFPWKYTQPNRLATTRNRLKGYKQNDRLGELFLVKEGLFAFDHSDIRAGLKIAWSIEGLGPAGASGLLAILFPRSFGTVDQFVVKALREVPSMSESAKLSAIKPTDLKLDEAAFLIEILRRKADALNTLFGTRDWTPRKIDMVLWSLREGDRC